MESLTSRNAAKRGSSINVEAIVANAADVLVSSIEERLKAIDNDQVLWSWNQIAEAAGVSGKTARKYATDKSIPSCDRLPVHNWGNGTPMTTKKTILDWAKRLSERDD